MDRFAPRPADGAGPGAGVQTWTAYDGANAWADFDAAGALATRYLMGPGMDALLARVSAAGAVGWYLADNLGSVRQIAATNGTVVLNTQSNQQNNTITFTPNAGYTGPASFSYTVSDGRGGTSTATVNFNVAPPGAAPRYVRRTRSPSVLLSS